MVTNKQTSERGAVALITAMIVSVLLMITTAGMVAVTVKSLRQSTDGAQSTKAYYAAEGGLEKALLDIRNNNNPNSCTTVQTSGASAKDGAVTCIKADTKTNVLVGDLDVDQTVQLDISGVIGLQSIKVEWGLPSGEFDANSVPQYATSARGSNFPSRSVWPGSAPAIVEAGVVEYPASSTFKIGEVKFYQPNFMPLSLKPGSAGRTNGFDLYSYQDMTASDKSQKPFVVPCTHAAPYQCSGGIEIDPAKKYVLRLKTRYNKASYRITAQGAGNVALSIPGAVWTIDVTARAGDTFRRIQTSFPIDQNPSGLPGLDYVLYSDTDICKSFQVKGGGAQPLDTDISCLPL